MSRTRTKSVRIRLKGTLLGFCLVLPMLMGGCPEFRDEIVGVANAATQGLVSGGLSEADAIDSVTQGILSAVIDLAFNELRSENAN